MIDVRDPKIEDSSDQFKIRNSFFKVPLNYNFSLVNLLYNKIFWISSTVYVTDCWTVQMLFLVLMLALATAASIPISDTTATVRQKRAPIFFGSYYAHPGREIHSYGYLCPILEGTVTYLLILKFYIQIWLLCCFNCIKFGLMSSLMNKYTITALFDIRFTECRFTIPKVLRRFFIPERIQYTNVHYLLIIF